MLIEFEVTKDGDSNVTNTVNMSKFMAIILFTYSKNNRRTRRALILHSNINIKNLNYHKHDEFGLGGCPTTTLLNYDQQITKIIIQYNSQFPVNAQISHSLFMLTFIAAALSVVSIPLLFGKLTRSVILNNQRIFRTIIVSKI